MAIEKLKCPECRGGHNEVFDSRPANGMIKRRRKCTGCDERFTTFELIVKGKTDSLGFSVSFDYGHRISKLDMDLRLRVIAAIEAAELMAQYRIN